MKEINYTDHRVKLLFIAGIILVFIMLFASFLYPRQIVDNSFKSLENKIDTKLTKNSRDYLNGTGNNEINTYAVNNCFHFNN